MAKEQFDKRGYSLSPQDVSDEFWYYEEPKGIFCVYQPRAAATGKLLFVAPAWYIPWAYLERSMKRHQTAKRRKRRPIK
mgnify:CR=1 FL=1